MGMFCWDTLHRIGRFLVLSPCSSKGADFLHVCLPSRGSEHHCPLKRAQYLPPSPLFPSHMFTTKISLAHLITSWCLHLKGPETVPSFWASKMYSLLCYLQIIIALFLYENMFSIPIPYRNKIKICHKNWHSSHCPIDKEPKGQGEQRLQKV